MTAPADQNDSREPAAAPETNSAPGPAPKFRPVLLIFLGMPILAALVALLIGGGSGAPASAPTPPIVVFTPASVVNVGSAAPDFALEQPGGGTIRLGDYRGGWLLLNFWATWCGPCRAEMPLLQDLVDGKMPEADAVPGGVSVLTVNFDEPAEAVEAYFGEMNLRLTTVLDPGAKVSRQYGAYQLPITLFVDPDGVVRYKHIGGMTQAVLADYLTQMADEAS